MKALKISLSFLVEAPDLGELRNSGCTLQEYAEQMLEGLSLNEVDNLCVRARLVSVELNESYVVVLKKELPNEHP